LCLRSILACKLVAYPLEDKGLNLKLWHAVSYELHVKVHELIDVHLPNQTDVCCKQQQKDADRRWIVETLFSNQKLRK
jgi:hypothetical protein